MSNQANNMKFAAWMAGTSGRVIRIVAGAALVILGVTIGGIGGVIVGLVGLVPVAAGITNRCLIAKFIGAPFKGQDSVDIVGS